MSKKKVRIVLDDETEYVGWTGDWFDRIGPFGFDGSEHWLTIAWTDQVDEEGTTFLVLPKSCIQLIEEV